MTSEIILGNHRGIVLAADSLLTSTPGEKPRIARAGKIHVMRDQPPMVVMVYGAARLCGWPWDRLVAEFSAEQTRSRPTWHASVDGCALAFLTWLDTTSLITEEHRRRELAAQMQAFVRQCVDDAADRVRRGEAISLSEAVELSVDTRLCAIDDLALQGASPRREHGLTAATRDRVLDSVLASIPLPRRTRRTVDSLMLAAAMAGIPGSGTGLVFAGYGADEMFPAVSHCSQVSMSPRGLQHGEPERQRISAHRRAVVSSYAETSAVNGFLFGIDHVLLRSARGSLQRYRDELPQVVASLVRAQGSSGFPPSDPGPCATAVEELLRASFQKLSDHQFRQVRPTWKDLLAGVSHQSPGELAEFAGALINLVGLRHRMTDASGGTVGGDVDVAVLTRSPHEGVHRMKFTCSVQSAVPTWT